MAPQVLTLEQLRQLAAETRAKTVELDGAIETLRHDLASLRAAVLYLNDCLDANDKGGSKR